MKNRTHPTVVPDGESMSLRSRSILIRTTNVDETARVIEQLLVKARCPPGVPTGSAPAAALTKRKRDADKDVVYLRMLQCLPGISQHVALKLAEHFPTLTLLRAGLQDLESFPNIRLDAKTCIGTLRLKRLRAQLCDID